MAYCEHYGTYNNYDLTLHDETWIVLKKAFHYEMCKRIVANNHSGKTFIDVWKFIETNRTAGNKFEK